MKPKAGRIEGLDALKAATTLLVVFHHAAITYGAIGGWFYREIDTDRSTASLLLAAAAAAPSGDPPRRPFPSNQTLLLAALGCAAAAFGLRLVWPVGTDVAGFHLGYFPTYVTPFVFGCRSARQGWFVALPAAQVRLWGRIAWITSPMLLPLAFLAGSFPILRGPATGGWTIPSLMYALWEPFLAWGILLGLLQWAGRPRAPAGPSQQALARRAYAIFVIHPTVVVAVAVAWHAVQAPALLKFLLTGLVSCWLCFWLAGALLRLPDVQRVL